MVTNIQYKMTRTTPTEKKNKRLKCCGRLTVRSSETPTSYSPESLCLIVKRPTDQRNIDKKTERQANPSQKYKRY